jgi:hypothetical protein
VLLLQSKLVLLPIYMDDWTSDNVDRNVPLGSDLDRKVSLSNEMDSDVPFDSDLDCKVSLRDGGVDCKVQLGSDLDRKVPLDDGMDSKVQLGSDLDRKVSLSDIDRNVPLGSGFLPSADVEVSSQVAERSKAPIRETVLEVVQRRQQ